MNKKYKPKLTKEIKHSKIVPSTLRILYGKNARRIRVNITKIGKGQYYEKKTNTTAKFQSTVYMINQRCIKETL